MPPARLLLTALAAFTTTSLFAAAPALNPSSARGVFWKQQKLEKNNEANVDEAPGTWGYDKAKIFTKLKNNGVNLIVIDVDTDIRLTEYANKRTAIGNFLKALYAWDNTMPIRVYLHQRRYFRGTYDLTKTPDQNDVEFAQAADDIKSVFAAVTTAESALIDGIRWGENGNTGMQIHMKRAILYARKLNATALKGSTNWLKDHSFIINGYDMGCEFKGLTTAETAVNFSTLIAPECGAFGWAYKHFSDRPEGGIGGIYNLYRNSFTPAKTDSVQTWKDFYIAELGLDQLQAWRDSRTTAHAHLKNYMYVGDSADSVSTTPANSLDAMKQFFSPKIRPVFMIPVAAASEKTNTNSYYNENKVLWWLGGTTTAPTFTNSTSYTQWSTGW